MPIEHWFSRRTFAGLPFGLAAACGWRRAPVPAPAIADLSYGPSPAQCFDVYSAPGPSGRLAPLVVLIHGGGWESGSRGEVAKFIPYFTERRCVVASIGYRLTPEAVAPAAAEDVRNAIASVCARAAEWHVDSGRVLLVGFSSGAHLALLAALAPPDAVSGPQCRARAVLSFWGVTDVADLLSGENERAFARRWLPESPGRLELARRLSPMQYDAAGAPALCAAHSVHDDIVPFAHSERLVDRFLQARVPARLTRLSHRGHAPSPGAYPAILNEAFHFLDGVGVFP